MVRIPMVCLKDFCAAGVAVFTLLVAASCRQSTNTELDQVAAPSPNQPQVPVSGEQPVAETTPSAKTKEVAAQEPVDPFASLPAPKGRRPEGGTAPISLLGLPGKRTPGDWLNQPIAEAVGFRVTPSYRLESSDERKAPKTCRNFLELSAEGYFDSSPNVDNMEWQLQRVCKSLDLLSRAWPATSSNVGDLSPPLHGMDLLPLAVINIYGDSLEPSQLTTSLKSTPSIKFKAPRTKDRRFSLTHVVGPEFDDKVEFEIELVGRGDFNYDGLEDVLLFVFGDSGGASSMIFYSTFVLTRRGPKGLYEVVARF